MNNRDGAVIFRRGDEQIMEGPIQLNATGCPHTLGVLDSDVEVLGTLTVNMPHAGEVPAGTRFRIRQTGVAACTLAYPGAAGTDPADKDLTAVDDYVISESDGRYWYGVSETLT